MRAKMIGGGGGGRSLVPEILDQSPIFDLFSLVATQP